MNGPHTRDMRGSPLLSAPGRFYCAWEIFMFLLATHTHTQKGYIEGNSFSTLYLHLLCLLVCRMKRGIYKGRGTGNAIKSLAFTGAVLRTKNLTRLGAAEVPADTHRQFALSLSLVTERSSALFSFIFLVFVPVPSSAKLSLSLCEVQLQLKVRATHNCINWRRTKTADRP